MTVAAAATRADQGRVRVATAADRRTIMDIFRATLALGEPLHVRGLDAYTDLALGWYLDHGHAALHLSPETRAPDGYVLVCTDEEGAERWKRGAAARYLARVGWRWLRGDLDREDRRFHRLRLADGWHLWRNAPARPGPAHIHLNLLRGARAGAAGRALATWADEVVTAAGHDRWYAEINAPEGRRAAAVTRLGGEVVHRAPNRTLSALLDQPVERLTVVRRCGPA